MILSSRRTWTRQVVITANIDSAIAAIITATHTLTLLSIERVSIAFPDDGSHKRFCKKFLDFPLIICSKALTPTLACTLAIIYTYIFTAVCRFVKATSGLCESKMATQMVGIV